MIKIMVHFECVAEATNAFVPKMNSVYSSYVKMPRYGSLVATGKKKKLQALLNNHDYGRFTIWMPKRMNLRSPYGTGPQPHMYPH
jgi:hypothetical protein